MADLDSGYQSFGAALINREAPYDPFTESGDPDDPTWYLLNPGQNFLRPWLAIRNGPAFRWPLGMEGYSHTVEPTLGLHKFIGDNRVLVDVVHMGEEHITINGTFPGLTGPSNWRALREIAIRPTPDEGKILYLPFVTEHAQRVAVVRCESTRTDDQRGTDLGYSLEVVRIGEVDKKETFGVVPSVHQSGTRTTGHTIKVDALHNTLRKIAAWKYGDSIYWRTLYTQNEEWFTSHKIPISQAPDHRIPTGTTIYY